MLEFLLCSLVTIFPDYLVRRFFQGKRIGHEITFFTMWYELRWGITACMLLTVLLLTLIYYYHPSTVHATPMFRTVTLLPEGGGRVEDVYVKNGQLVEAGEPLFSLLETTEAAAVNVSRSQIAEIESALIVAESDLAAAAGQVEKAQGSLDQARNEYRMKTELRAKDYNIVSDQEVARLRNLVASRKGSLAAAKAARDAAEAELSNVLPARKASAEEALEQAQVELDKTTIYAGTNGRVIQFLLKPGDFVNPMIRPAGLLVPTDTVESGHHMVQAGFNQFAAAVLKVGMAAEISCQAKPFTVIPMVVVRIQGVIAAGQMRPADQLVDLQDRARPGALMVWLEPMYEDGLKDLMPGTKCIANAYTNNHELLVSGELNGGQKLWLHMIDTVGVVHAIILRIQTIVMPIKSLVFAGH